MHAHTHTHTRVHARIHPHPLTHPPTHTHTCTCTYTSPPTHTHTHTCTCTYTSPPTHTPTHARRYIYLWIKYAIFEELDAADVGRAREVYRAALKLVPHHIFTFTKVRTCMLMYMRLFVGEGPAALKLAGALSYFHLHQCAYMHACLCVSVCGGGEGGPG